jgi:hypothetical protein
MRLALLLLPAIAMAQTPDLSGVWSPSRATGPTAPAKPTPIVVKAAYKAAYDARRAAEQAASARGEQLAAQGLCAPYGMPTMMTVAVYPVEIIQTPQQVTIIGEVLNEVRRVYMNKPQLPWDEVPPSYVGRSVGKWEGDTLVIDTVGIKETSRAYQGLPHTPKFHITERIRRVGADMLYDTITLDDPDVLEQPVTYTLTFRKLDDYEMVEFVCENNREYIDENGIVRMRLQGK